MGDKTATIPITVVIEDPCDSVTIIEPTLATQSYTITDLNNIYDLSPKIAAVPDYCELSFALISPSELASYASLNEISQRFTLS